MFVSDREYGKREGFGQMGIILYALYACRPAWIGVRDVLLPSGVSSSKNPQASPGREAGG